MPISNVSVKNVIISQATEGILISQAKGVTLENVRIEAPGEVLRIKNAEEVSVNGKKYENKTSKAQAIGM